MHPQHASEGPGTHVLALQQQRDGVTTRAQLTAIGGQELRLGQVDARGEGAHASKVVCKDEIDTGSHCNLPQQIEPPWAKQPDLLVDLNADNTMQCSAHS